MLCCIMQNYLRSFGQKLWVPLYISRTDHLIHISMEEHLIEIFHGQKPNLSHLHVFGYLATVHVPKQQRLKIDAKAKVKVFIGYSDDVKGYRLIDPQTLAVTVSRNVIFHEDKFLCDMENIRNIHPVVAAEDLVSIDYCGGNYQDDEDDETEDNSDQRSDAPVSRDVSEKTDNLVHEENTAQVGATYEETFMHQVRSLPAKRPSALRPSNELPHHCKLAESLTSEVNEPDNIYQAWHSEHSKQWHEATDSEFTSLIDTHTRDLVPLPYNKNIVGCKWIFKVKRKADNTIDRFKARLVAQGSSQEEGVDFYEVFSLVARFTTLRTVLALTTLLDLELHQLDVKTAFLNGTLEEEIYTRQPEGYIDEKHPDYVCKLRRSLY